MPLPPLDLDDDGRFDVTVVADAARHAARARRRARPLGARTTIRRPPRARQHGACPISSSTTSTAAPSTSRPCAAGRSCSSRGRRGEDAASTCPGGRRCTRSWRRRGVEIVTVALDTDVEAARPFHEAAHPTHPSLVDPGHVIVGLFGMTNVPFAIWIDEDGTHRATRRAGVRAAPAAAARARTSRALIAQLPERQRKIIEQMTTSMRDPERYPAAVRDWAAHGRDEPVRAARRRRSSNGRGRARPSSGWPPPTSSSRSTCTGPASRATPSRTSRRRTGWTRRTGATTARR